MFRSMNIHGENHSGLPLRAKTGQRLRRAKLLASGLAGACWNPFWVYFRLKLARVRRLKKNGRLFLRSKGRFLADFHQIWPPKHPIFIKIPNTRVSDAFWVLLPGEQIWNHEIFFADFWPSRASRGPMSGVPRPKLGTRQLRRPRRVFHRQKLPARLKKVSRFADRVRSQPRVLAPTAPKRATCSIGLWSQSGRNVSEARTFIFPKLPLSTRELA